MHRMLLSWGVGYGLYLLFTGPPSRAELCAAAITASFGAALVLFLQLRGGARMRARAAPWAVLGFRLARSVAVDLARVGRALAAAIAGRSVRGMIVKQPFQPGPVAPDANARRGIVFLLGSLAPNGFALDLDRKGAALIFHRLVAAPPSPDEQWPV